MAIENINAYSERWQNGVSVGAMWDKIKAMFVSGHHDQTAYPADWKKQARANIGLTIQDQHIWYGNGANVIGQLQVSGLGKTLLNSSISAGEMWYGSAPNTISVLNTTEMGRGLLTKGITKNAIWYGSDTNTIGEIVTSQVGRDVLVTTGASAVTNLWATKATQDGSGNTIKSHYAHSLGFVMVNNGTVLRLKNANDNELSNIPVNTNLGLLRLDNNGIAGKIPIVHIPDSILGQLTYGGTITYYIQAVDGLLVSITTGGKEILEQKTGKTIGNKAVRLLAIEKSSSSWPSDTDEFVYFNYADCKGMFFIWTDAALENHSGESARYRIWPSSSYKRYQSGDWLISNDTEWDKVDNTDAVTGVKGSNESTYRLNNVSIDALDVRALATYATSGGQQTVADNVQFNHNVWALGGMAANGLTDLALAGGGGGGGTVTRIKIGTSATAYEPSAGLVTIPVTTGANTPAGSFGLGGQDIAVKGLGSLAFKSSVSLTELGDARDIQAIELLSGTSGFLKKTAANTWALDTTVVTTTATQALTNKTYNGYTLAAACAKGVDTSLTASSTSANLPTSAAVASLVSGYLPKSGGMIDGTSAYPLQISGNTVRAGITYYHSDTTTAFGTIGVYESSTGVYNPFFGQGNNTYKIWHENNDGSGSGLDADTLDGTHKSGLFTLLENSSEQVSVTIGGTNKKLTVDYATKALQMKQEPKPDQEFVYRQSPQTIDADSLVINKFKGRTLVWNQLCPKSTKASFTSSNVTFTNNNDGTWTLNGTSNALSTPGLGSLNVYFIATHKYLLRGSCGNGIELYLESSTIWGSTKYDIGSGVIATCVSSGSNSPWLLIQNGHTYNNAVVAPQITDLTLMFGAGNEPSTVAEFEALYPNAYYKYNAGQLINNDAKQFESVGFNLWDEECELGQLNNQGQPTADSNGLRGTNYTRCKPNTQYYLANTRGLGTSIVVYFYDSSYNMIPYTGTGAYQNGYNGGQGIFTTPANSAYMRFRCAAQYGTTYKNDICINISDPAKNGTYEPYRHIVTDLNLDAIQVKSHNIWDENMAFGYGLSGSTGELIPVSGYQATRNKIAIYPSTTYYFKSPQGASYATFFDKNGTFLSSRSLSSIAANSTFTTPSDAYYMNLQFTGYGSTYNNDICINESSSFNGQYEPHGILTINGLKQAGSVYDEIVGNKLVKRIGSVDMGTLDWTLAGTVFQSGLADKKIISGGWRVGGVCARYLISPSNNSRETPDKCFSYGWESTLLFVNDTSYSTVEAFKTAMNGVYLNYELATPIEYELASPIPNTMPAGTTERIISDRLPVTPFACDMTYGANPKDILASGIAWEKIWGRPQLAKGSYSDSVISGSGEWFKLDVGGQVLYVQFAVGTGAFRLKIADSDDEDAATVSKEFAFATLSTDDIDAICV